MEHLSPRDGGTESEGSGDDSDGSGEQREGFQDTASSEGSLFVVSYESSSDLDWDRVVKQGCPG